MVKSVSDGVAIAELQRRVTENERRIEWLDQHGSRTVNLVAAQVADLSKDFSELKGIVQTSLSAIEYKRNVRWTQILGFVALILPIYGLVITLIVSKGH